LSIFPAPAAEFAVGAVDQDLGARDARYGHPVVGCRRQRDAVLMLEEGIDDIEEVPRELRVRPGTARQLIG